MLLNRKYQDQWMSILQKIHKVAHNVVDFAVEKKVLSLRKIERFFNFYIKI